MTVHHSAGPGQTFDTVRSIAYQHVWTKNENKNEWPGIGYTFCVNRDGYIWQVNELETWSFHAGTSEGNRNHIGVCLLGNFTSAPPTDKQIQAAIDLHAHLCIKLGKQLGVTKHQDFKGTACPGATWPQWYHRISGGDPVNPKPAVDLLDYLGGDGRLYEVRHSNGAQERFQVRTEGNTFWLIKNSQYETFEFDNDFIWRGLDTSPGPAPKEAERPGQPRMYLQHELGKDTARWCKRYMAIGETYTGPGHVVKFFYKDTCQSSALNSGPATNKVTLVAKHGSKTWNGITVNDVVELQTGTGETMFFGRGYGLVAWSSPWGSSAISEVHQPGARPDNVRENISCL